MANNFFHNLVFGYFRAMKVVTIIAILDIAVIFGNLNPAKPMMIEKKNIMQKVFAQLSSQILFMNLNGLNLPRDVPMEVS